MSTKEPGPALVLTVYDVLSYFGTEEFTFEAWARQFRRSPSGKGRESKGDAPMLESHKRAWERFKRSLRVHGIPHDRPSFPDPHRPGADVVGLRLTEQTQAFIDDRLPPLEVDEDLGEAMLELAEQIGRVA